MEAAHMTPIIDKALMTVRGQGDVAFVWPGTIE